jgi:predicted nucleic acid-binding protein
MIVVSNTSPIVNLACIGRLSLLEQLYDRIVIPQAVRREIADAGAGQPGAREVQTLDWIETRAATNLALVTSLKMELSEGEAEAIALAVELKADLVLLDERRARTVASRFGLRFIGLLGALVEAKHKKLFPALKPVLDDLIAKAGFWISAALYHKVLQSVGEE